MHRLYIASHLLTYCISNEMDLLELSITLFLGKWPVGKDIRKNLDVVLFMTTWYVNTMLGFLLFALICYGLTFNMTVFLEFLFRVCLYSYIDCERIKFKGWSFVSLLKPFLLVLELTLLCIFQAFIWQVSFNQYFVNTINRKW